MKLKYPIVAFTGPAGAGKTTAGNALCKAVGDLEAESIGGVVLYSLADPIRLMLRTLGVPILNLTGPDHKEIPMPQFGGKSARQLMQTLGTEWGRNQVDPAIWLDAATRQILHMMQGGIQVVIDDVRFDNEAARIRDLGGYVVEVDRKGGAPRGNHASERGVSSHLIDGYITNDMTPAFAASVVNRFLE